MTTADTGISNGPQTFQFQTQDDPIGLVHRLKQEAQSNRKDYEAQWTTNKQLDIGNQWDFEPPEDRTHLVINNISRQIDGIVATMLESRPRITFSPTRDGSRSMLYMMPEVGEELLATLLTGGKNGEPIPLRGLFDPNAPLEKLDVILGERSAPERTFKAAMETGLISEDDVYRVNDTTQADLLKAGVMGTWDWYKWDWLIAEQWRAALVVGHRDLMVYWHEDLEDAQLWPILEKDSWIDPNPCCTDIDTSSYYICAQVMPVEQAVALVGDDPEKAEAIRKNTEDPAHVTGVDGEPLSDKYSEIDWQRDMSVLYTAWIRNQTFTAQTPDGPTTRRGLRQIRFVANVLLEDGLSPFPDIPVVRFKNVPITDQPYAIGEPEVMKDVQQVWNRIHSNFHDDIRIHVGPQQVIASPLAKYFVGRNAYSRPNRIIPVPMAMLDAARHAPVQFIAPPGLNQSHMQYAGFVQQIMNELGLQTDVLRGQGAGDQSGRAIGLLQNAGRGVIAMRSFWFEKAVARIAELVRWMMVNWMPTEKWMQYSDRYPPHVLEDMLKRAANARFTTVAQVAAGRAQRKEVEQQKALNLRSTGDLSFETMFEKMDMGDPPEEKKRIEQEQFDKVRLNVALQQQLGLQSPEQDANNTADGES